MAGNVVRAIWREPRVPEPVDPPRWDRLLVAVLVAAAVLEGVLRDDVPWPAYSVVLAVVCALALLVRRSRPLTAVIVGYGAQTVAGVGPDLAGRDYGVLYVTSCVLLLLYSLGRWSSGRGLVLGLTFVLTCHLVREPLYDSSGISILVGVGFLLFPAALGAALRFWARAKRRETEQIRLQEREQLARELHDTVAHHVSGIVIQAQAGRAVAAGDPERAADVLRVIEDAAKHSLAEMRSLVGILRTDEEAGRAPVPGIADLERLVRGETTPPEISLELDGELEGLGASTGAAVYRLVQESITNARRHARSAARIEVRVSGGADVLRVEVSDDGRGPFAAPGDGYGLVGMSERVELLGGSLCAGPHADGGWSVVATIPIGGRV